jgi:hypothetical protein
MKISSLHHKIKDATRFWLVLLPSLFCGCAPVVAEAPFPARPDTVEPGDLVGPFDGRVVDAATGHPLAGALVFASWGLEVGDGITAPGGAVTATVETDSDGRYKVDKLHSWPGRRTRVSQFTLLVYKAGYVGYRSDRRFDDLGARRDFAQQGNQVKMERFPRGLSHVRHVRFLGGGGALRAALSSEYVQASLELAGKSSALEGAQPGAALLDVSGLLTTDELKAVTGFSGTFVIDRLADLPQSPGYDSKHFRAENKPESYDAAIRVWRLPAAATAARWETMVKEIPHASEGHAAGDASVTGYDGKILAAGVVVKSKGLVLELTCGVDLCRDTTQAMALLKRVLPRAERLAGEAPPIKKPEEKPPEEKTEERPEEMKSEPEEEKPFQLKPPELHR